MAEEKLIKYQTEAYKEVVGEYFFECTHPSVKKIAKSTKIQGLKKGIKLHLFRYGLFEKKSTNDTAFNYSSTIGNKKTDGTTEKKKKFTVEEVEVTNDKIPAVENFYLARTFLREGYVYIINKANNEEYKEYKVEESGKLKGIIWYKGNNGDVREANGDSSSFITLPKAGEYYIAYSPVQWSKKMFNDINGDEELKEELMHTINCVGIKIGEEATSDEVVSYKDVTVVSLKKHPLKGEVKANLKEIHIDEEKQSEKGDNEYYEDMFITLHDAVGCAVDISEALGEKIIDFKALVDAIQTGETEKEALQRYETLPPKAAPEPTKEYRDMFSLALVSYKMVYSSQKSTKLYDGGKAGNNWGDNHFIYQDKPKIEFYTSPNKFDDGIKYRYTNGYQENEYIGAGLHREKVEGIIGVHQRRAKRKIVNEYRDILGNFIHSTYYINGLEFYVMNSPEYFVFGIQLVYEKIKLLYLNPYDIDRHLLLNPGNDREKDVYQSTDKWITWFNKTKWKNQPEEDNNLEKLLVHELSIDQKLVNNWVDLSNKFAAASAAKLDFYSLDEYFFKSKKITNTRGKTNYQKIINEGYEEIVDRLNKITITTTKGGKAEKVFHFSSNDGIQMNASLLGADFDPTFQVVVKGPNGKNIKQFTTDLIEHNRLYGKNATNAGGNHKVTVGDDVKNISKQAYQENLIKEQGAKRFNQKAYNVLNSRGFTGVLTGLQIVNFSYASLGLYEAIRKEKSNTELLKAGINTVGIGAELTEASLNLIKAHNKAIGKSITKKAAIQLSNKITVAGAIGGVITVGMCVWEGVLAFNKRDEDAAVAWGLAASAFAVSTAAGLWGSSVLLLSGPVGWIALGIGFLMVALAYIFTDSDMQYYFKNFLLSDQESYPPNGKSPMDYNRYLFTLQKKLVDSEDTDVKNKLMHPADAIASLHDLTVCTNVKYYIPKSGNAYERHGELRGRSIRSVHYIIHGFGFSMDFNQFLNSPEQLEVKGILLDSKNNDTTPFDLEIKKALVSSLKTGQQQLSAMVSLPSKQKGLIREGSTELVIAIRVRIDANTNHYFPHPLRNIPERYMAVKFNLFRTIYNINDTEEQKPIFDSLANLKLDKTW